MGVARTARATGQQNRYLNVEVFGTINFDDNRQFDFHCHDAYYWATTR